jgi:hypothetical protein
MRCTWIIDVLLSLLTEIIKLLKEKQRGFKI